MAEHKAPKPPAIPGASYARFLGSGGFADVFLYHQQSPSRDVAVKVIRQEAQDQQRERFKRETDTMALLSSHPSVVSVFDAGQTQDGRGFIVMEYCPPPHLGKLCKQEQPSIELVLKYAIQIGSAVETIHRSGFLHRDIKPANILLTPFKRPVLTDFGIAVPIEAQVVDEDFGGASPPWAPYEQQLGTQALTPASDVYSLGATVYTLLTGHPPHVDPALGASNEQADMLRRAQSGTIAPITRPDVPDQLRRVLRKAMERRPADRYATALALVRDLQKVQRDQNLTVTEAEVMEQALPDTGPQGDSDHTVLRPVTSIDPYRGTQDSLVADATRFRPRIVTPLPQADERTSADTLLGGADPLSSVNSGQGPAEAYMETVPVSLTGMRAAPTNATSLKQDPLAPQQDSQGDHASQGASPRRVLTAVLALVLVLALGGVGLWSTLRHEGGTKQVGASASPEPDVVGPGGEVASDVGVSNLRLSVEGGTVTATWDYSGDEGTTFLYSVIDPVGEQVVKDTTEHTATVDALPGRTCVEVVARSSSGASSVPQTECLETP